MLRDSLKDVLEIILITYNRSKALNSTLNQILDKNSPVNDINITVIDNKSSDSTPSIVKDFQKTHSNLKYIRNKYNIGGNGNIMKAFYEAQKKYIWVLADNDDYTWDSWGEVENAIEQDADAIVVSTYECPSYDVAQLYIQTTFLPGVIYKTSNIDDGVLSNMAYNISNMFPHLALSSKLINENKKFAIVSKQIVHVGDNTDVETGSNNYTRGYKKNEAHPTMRKMNWLVGFANSTLLIDDKKVRKYIVNHNMFWLAPLNSMQIFIYNKQEKKMSLYNFFCIFNVLDFWGKVKFLIDAILMHTVFLPVFIYAENIRPKSEDAKFLEVQFYIRLCYLLKSKLFKIKIKNKRYKK